MLVGTGIAVIPSANPIVFGQDVNVTATVKAISPGTGVPTIGELLTFTDVTDGQPGVTLGTQTIDASGTAVLDLPGGIFDVRPHKIQVSYDGDSTFLPGSNTLTLTIHKDSTTTSVTSSGTPFYGQPVTLTAAVTANSPGSGVPSGNVTFYDGSVAAARLIGTSALDSSTATASVVTSSLRRRDAQDHRRLRRRQQLQQQPGHAFSGHRQGDDVDDHHRDRDHLGRGERGSTASPSPSVPPWASSRGPAHPPEV